MGNEAGREAFHARDVDAVGDLAGEGEEEAADVLRVEDPLHAAVGEFPDRGIGGDAASLAHSGADRDAAFLCHEISSDQCPFNT